MVTRRYISILDLFSVQRKLANGALQDEKQTPRREIGTRTMFIVLYVDVLFRATSARLGG